MITLYWDFFGPHADGTATHFRRHVDEFLVREGIEGCETGVGGQRDGHREAWCRAPEAVAETVGRALRARRVVQEPMP